MRCLPCLVAPVLSTVMWAAALAGLLAGLLAGAPAPAGADGAMGGVRLGEVLAVVGDESEARARLQPAALLEGALEAAAGAVPPLLVERRAGPGGPVLHLRLGPRRTSFALAELDSLERLEAALEAARQFIAAALAPGAPPPRLAAVLAEGLLAELDAHSGLLSAAAYGDFQSQASGRIGGLGMLLHRHEGHLAVESVLPESPAARAGVRPGDRLLQIGARAALHLPVDEALGLIRGRVGTRVDVLIVRPGEPAPRPLGLRRSDLRFASVESRLVREGLRERIAYVRVRSFQETTTAELRGHLHRLRVGRAGLVGIVLDLRDNPGGVLEQAIRVADLFLERGTIVTMRGPRIEPEAVPARWYRTMTSAPLVVLVNGGTASAAEIVVGALKHNHRALLVGTPSFGKSTIQSVFPLSGGNALKLTVARFRPGGGRPIGGEGVTPHVVLRPVRLGAAGAGTRGLLRTAMAPVPQHDGQPVRELPYLQAPPTGDGAAPDFALRTAVRLLRRNAPQGQAALLGNAVDWARHERRRQDPRIVDALAGLGVDWSPGPGRGGGQAELARATLAVRTRPDSAWAPLAVDAGVPGGARLRLTLELRNAGALPLHRVLAVTESEAPYLDGLELPVGLLPAGGSAQAAVEVTAPVDLPQGPEPVRLRIYDGRRQLHYRATLFVPQVAPPPVRLRLAVKAVDDGTAGSRGNGDGRPQAGEVVALRVRLENAGDAPSGTGRYWVGGTGVAEAPGLRSWRAFGSVAPGQATEGALLLSTGTAPGAWPAALTLSLMSDRLAAPELTWGFRLHPGQALPARTLEPPRLAVRPAAYTGPAAEVTLHGAARDDRALREVLVYRNGRKVHYTPVPAAPEGRNGPGAERAGVTAALPLRLTVPLEPGRNLVRVVARDRDGLETHRSYVLWRGEGRGFPLSSAAPDGA